MKKVVRLTESDLMRIVKRVINESDYNETPQWLKSIKSKSKFFLDSQDGQVMVRVHYDEKSNLLDIEVESGNMMKYYQYGPLISKEVDDMLNEVSDEYNVEFKFKDSNMESFDNAHTKNNTSDFSSDGYVMRFKYKVIN